MQEPNRTKKLHMFFLSVTTENKSARMKQNFVQNSITQGVSRLVDITAGGDFLGLCDKKVHINMCPILDGYGVMGIFNIVIYTGCFTTCGHYCRR